MCFSPFFSVSVLLIILPSCSCLADPSTEMAQGAERASKNRSINTLGLLPSKSGDISEEPRTASSSVDTGERSRFHVHSGCFKGGEQHSSEVLVSDGLMLTRGNSTLNLAMRALNKCLPR